MTYGKAGAPTTVGTTFEITSPTTTAKLDARRHALVTFTVTNTLSQPLKARAKVDPIDGAKPEWFKFDGEAERPFAANGVQQYAVNIAVPPAIPATEPGKTFTFKLRVGALVNPDELFGEGPGVGFAIPPAERKPAPSPPWIWFVIAAASVLLVAAVVVGWILTHRQPVASFNPGAPTFSQHVGVGSSPKTITIKNSGPVDLHIRSITVSGTNASDFSTTVDSCSGKTLPSNATCNIGMIFFPHASGARLATLVVSSNTSAGIDSIPLSGQGIEPVVALDRTSLSLTFVSCAPTVLCALSVQPVTVKNVGTGDLHVTGVSTEQPFHASSPTCIGHAIAPQQTCRVFVSFGPAQGSYRGTLVISDDADPGTQAVQLSGVGK